MRHLGTKNDRILMICSQLFLCPINNYCNAYSYRVIFITIIITKTIEFNVKETILSPDYIIEDKKHRDTGLVVRKIYSDKKSTRHSFLILKICTDTENGELANSIISGWVISEKRLNSYLRNKTILYKKEQSC